ncbi:unnamed protein product [Rhizophagus irregularis]|uniref:Uncharacterized protein n=1 Tax=Rhizophagus irregularis TaxID=588596 RepID=A0A916EDG6_9GLOM|nr:unnamed protein product [Rhizophagus irregularis]CAB5373803.1 unnamed protein product [Rhizophagus irregularis]
MEIERSELNSLKVKDFSLVIHFESGHYENERLLKDCEESLCDYNIVESTANFVSLKENNKCLIDLIETQKAIDEDIFILAEALLSKLENQEVLSNYRDWISYFNKFLRAELDANTWFKAQRAVYNKIANKLVNYAESEKEYILELEKALKNIKMTFYQYEMLILLKLKSNIEFHDDVRQTKIQAQDKLDSFPKDMQIFKDLLQQLFSSLDALMSYQQNK